MSTERISLQDYTKLIAEIAQRTKDTDGCITCYHGRDLYDVLYRRMGKEDFFAFTKIWNAKEQKRSDGGSQIEWGKQSRCIYLSVLLDAIVEFYESRWVS